MSGVVFDERTTDRLILNLDVLCSIPLKASYLDKSRRRACVRFSLGLGRAPRPGTKVYDVVVESMWSQTAACGDGTRAVLTLENAAKRMAEPRGIMLRNLGATRSGRAFGEKLGRCCGYTSDGGGLNYHSPAEHLLQDATTLRGGLK